MSLLSRLAVQAARAYGVLSAVDKNKVSADYLVVAGGGGGAQGGGGAGGMLTSTATLSTLNTYSITVGSGGNGVLGDPVTAGQGGNSVISGTGLSTITATGGGGGAGGGTATPGNGGSGGGAQAYNVSVKPGGTGISGQGNNGGSNDTPAPYPAGGGGGAGAVGGNGSGSTGGAGGAGLSSSISGSSVTYAGGGGGGTYSTGTGGAGGSGGGGAGSGNITVGSNGTANTGGGGGGSGQNYAGGNGGSGIVIISYTSATPKFVGGTITTSGGKQIHTFTSSGTLSPITPITASYLVVAGGGGGGNAIGGGGGAGGLLTSSTTLYSGATYVVTVGAGGAGGTNSSSPALGVTGSSSSMSGTGLTTITTTGGGGGGAGSTVAGLTGGSGGGGSGINGAGGSATSGQGFAGGAGSSGSGNYGAGGGGGSSAVGGTGNTTTAGSGGAGTASSISGTSVTYAGGGGGGTFSAGTAGTGGSGGGGAGSNTTVIGVSGTPNTGGGGGGGFQSSGGTNYNGGAGGSGIVIISYAGSQAFNGGLVTSSGGNTIHTFTSTGALTPLTNNLNNSLRFRSSASAFLSRTFASTGTNNKIQTFSAWVKRGLLSSSANYRLMGCYNGSASWSTEINFSNDSFRIEFGGSAQYELKTTQVFRDPSAWYHFVIAIDTTQATAANRIKMYVNGNQITAFATANYPAQNDSSQLGSATANNKIGANWNTSGAADYFDGYMTDINFIDGQALEPYYFGNNDANGVWKPIQYKGTYGTNGFYLNFADTSALTTSSNAGLGKDTSGNGNYWTTNNISITSGSTYDAMTDVPTNTSATVANYGVINPLSSGGSITNGNLTFSNSGAVKGCKGSFALESGKWYWENTITTVGATDLGVGIIFNGATDAMRDGTATLTYGVMYQANTNVRKNGTVVANYASYTTGDVIGIAYDADTRSITFYKNNTSQGSITADEPTSPYVALIMQPNTTSATVNANFGQRPFTYTPPTGYVALNTYNLPTPTILQGNKYMDATLYTGTGTALNVVNAGQFKPDLVWLKSRSQAYNNGLFDSNRGTTKELVSNSTGTETNGVSGLTAFNSNGFTLGTNPGFNESTTTFVGWQWQAGQGTNTTNTAGSITSTVSVNTTAGFSIVTYTGAGGSASTVGHGLGVKPAFMIFKERTATGTSGGVWNVYFIPSNLSGQLNLTNAFSTNSGGTNGSINTTTGLTSSLFGFIAGSSSTNNWNNSGSTYVAYCWAEIAGFSRFGSYTGNGSTDGPFVYLGFRPKWVLIKRTDSSTSGNWSLLDSSINTYNEAQKILTPNTADSESTQNYLDLLSNGFKVRYAAANQQINTNGGSYIYAAFAENPFKNSNAR